MAMAFAAITGLCMTSPLHAGQSRPPHGGSGGGSPGGGTFYVTVTNLTQLIGDINYADRSGGSFTIYLQPNTTFNLVTNYTCGAVGCSLLPGIGGTNAVNLNIIGNGSTIQRDATNANAYEGRLFEVAQGSSLTLQQITLQNGYSYAYNGGAFYNWGTLSLVNCTLTGNTAHYSGYIATLLGGKGGAIYNNHGTVLISNSILSGNLATGAFAYGAIIYNDSGAVTISNSILSQNSAFSGVPGDFAQLAEGGGIYNDSGAVTLNHSILTGNGADYGGGIFNSGTVTVENASSITGNTASDLSADVHNAGMLYLDSTSTIGILDGNLPIRFYQQLPPELIR